MSSPVQPAHIELQLVGVAIAWQDGHQSFYTYRSLRQRCPCVQCVEEMTGRHLLDPGSVSEEIQAIDYMPIGYYALQFLFTDAHTTGIYPFEYLRRLCPCDRCVRERGQPRA